MKLYVGDRYNKIVDVMNICFGWNYKACMKGWYVLNNKKKTSVWLPKIVDLRNGKPKPGDKWYGWCNTISDDYNVIYMNNYANPKRLNMIKNDGIEPHLTFIKLPGDNMYTYVGIYCRTKKDAQKGWVYERIAEDVEIDDYL